MSQAPTTHPLLGLMQDWPLTVDRFISHAALNHGHRQIVTRQEDGSIGRRSYAETQARAKRVSNALLTHGVVQGDRIATLAMNSVAHLEAWYGVCGIGAVCHTLNPRLFVEQLVYIVNHAQDRILFSDRAFAALAADLTAHCPSVERVIFLDDDLDLFVTGQSEVCAWGEFDENLAAGLCYTSGTTGAPKGVLYSHRSNVLHTLISLQPDMLNLGVRDCILPVVPMYHANAWGVAFSAPAVGAKLVLPGARLDGASLTELIEQEGVTVALGVPTVWLSLLEHMTANNLRPSTLERVVVGGAACPERVIRQFADLGVDTVHAWGMTEMSPVGGVCSLTPELEGLSLDEQLPWRLKQGRSPFGVELKLVGPDDSALPRDGVRMGSLRVRGPTIASAYFGGPDDVLDEEGYFDTGDIATIDELGFVQITDRAKDIIKSGGEWISSQDIENAALMHPKAAMAGVIGVPHPRWGERPVLYIQLKAGAESTPEEFLAFLTDKLAKWCQPERVMFLDAFPLGPTGKVDKKRLRDIEAGAS